MIWDDELEILERYSFPNRLFSSNVVLHSFVVVVVLSSLLLILSLLLFVTSRFLYYIVCFFCVYLSLLTISVTVL